MGHCNMLSYGLVDFSFLPQIKNISHDWKVGNCIRSKIHTPQCLQSVPGLVILVSPGDNVCRTCFQIFDSSTLTGFRLLPLWMPIPRFFIYELRWIHSWKFHFRNSANVKWRVVLIDCNNHLLTD
jgi:hypothetical protein